MSISEQRIRRCIVALAIAAMLCALPGCTTTAAKKAMNKPVLKDAYTSFDEGSADASKRKADKVEPIKPDTEAEQAITKLVEQLQREEPAYTVAAEEQLRMWGAQQGVDKIVYSKVRLLLKNPRVEVRAPALRLVKQFGGKEAVGDLIEALADNERAIRQDALKALQTRVHRDSAGRATDCAAVARPG